MKTCKCGKEIYRNGKCKECQQIYIREYMRKRRNGKAEVSEVKVEAKVLEPSLPLKSEVSDEDRNTIRDPNPDWNPEKILSSYNRTMECPHCGKLSLTHRKMCSPEARNYGYNDCYATK